ncbi:hypothetical protein Mapa_002766 [Marchantia paleacea]|nr:hypothetical protein Mapa_002766 [Marchantia paleacea]
MDLSATETTASPGFDKCIGSTRKLRSTEKRRCLKLDGFRKPSGRMRDRLSDSS